MGTPAVPAALPAGLIVTAVSEPLAADLAEHPSIGGNTRSLGTLTVIASPGASERHVASAVESTVRRFGVHSCVVQVEVRAEALVAMERVAETAGFHLESRQLELSGICNDCRNSQ